MVIKTDFEILQQEGNFVVKGCSYYQDIDFQKGGKILTLQRAEEIRDILIEQINNPPQIEEVSEDKLKEIERKQQLMEQAINELILGGF